MSQEDIESLMKIDNYVDTEEVFEEDDTSEELSRVYDEHSWPEDDPTGYSFKGKKKLFIKAVESLKIVMKKGNQKVIDDVTFKVLDSRKKSNELDYDVEVCKDKERGVASMKIFGPKEKKGCTILLNKSKKYDVKYLEILAFGVIKRLLDCFGGGDGWINIFKDGSSKATDNKKPFSCHFCNKGFVMEKNLKVHIEKFHRIVIKHSCEKCEFDSESEIKLKEHIEKKHSDKLAVNINFIDTVNARIEIKDNNKRNREHSTSDSLLSSPPGKRAQEERNLPTIEEECLIDDDAMNDVKEDVEHRQDQNVQEQDTSEIMDVDDNKTNVMDKAIEDVKENTVDDKLAMDEMKKKIQKLEIMHEKIVSELNAKLESKQNEFDIVKQKLDEVVKEEVKRKAEVTKLKSENEKISIEIGQLQYDKDKFEAEVKAKEKLSKIKQNTKLFNELIEKQIDDGSIKNVDITKYKDAEMEECDGGFGNDSLDLDSLRRNKMAGGKRTSPQETSDVRISGRKNTERKLLKCPQCDFISQNESFFNEHISKAHSGQPNCPFCFLPFNGYTELRKHCISQHNENKNELPSAVSNSANNIPQGRLPKVNLTEGGKPKRPCRYFKNGQGRCIQRFGKVCEFDHSIIPFDQREVCFHKQACSFKPNCIFYHPEGQNEVWQTNVKNAVKICRYAENGVQCMRSECTFYHPSIRKNQGFHWEQMMKPPLAKSSNMMTSTIKTPVRIPVIVRNQQKEKEDLSQTLKGLALD